jgi:hypothetical protein
VLSIKADVDIYKGIFSDGGQLRFEEMYREGKIDLCGPVACFSKKLTDGIVSQNQEEG